MSIYNEIGRWMILSPLIAILGTIIVFLSKVIIDNIGWKVYLKYLAIILGISIYIGLAFYLLNL